MSDTSGNKLNNETATLLEDVALTGCASGSFIRVYKLGNSNRRLMACGITLSSALGANKTFTVARTTQKPMVYTTTGHGQNFAADNKWYGCTVTINPNNGDINMINGAPVSSLLNTALCIYYNV